MTRHILLIVLFSVWCVSPSFAQGQPSTQPPPATQAPTPSLPNVPQLPNVPSFSPDSVLNSLGTQLGIPGLGGSLTDLSSLSDSLTSSIGGGLDCRFCKEVVDVKGTPVLGGGIPPGKQCCTSCTAPTAAVREAMDTHRKDFLMGTLWTDYVRPALRAMSTELSANMAAQTASLGTFIDAQTQITSVRAIQKMQAQAIKDYTPSEELCSFGTLAASLSESDLRSDAIKIVMSEMALARNLGTSNNAAAAGAGEDISNRVSFFIKEFCDVTNNNYTGPQTGLTLMCGTARQADFKFNRDIDYARTIHQPQTLRVDFLTAGAPSIEEKEVDGLIYNLYGHKQMTARITPSQIKTAAGQRSYMLERSMVARRMLAQNSLNSIVAMKAQGGGVNAQFVQSVLASLGLSAQEARQLSGTNPSYFAQMDVLTKRLYQSPQFYTGLMDKPANVTRQTAAMEALALMQERDTYRAVRRSEMLMAALLELSTRDIEMQTLDKVAGESARRTERGR